MNCRFSLHNLPHEVHSHSFLRTQRRIRMRKHGNLIADHATMSALWPSLELTSILVGCCDRVALKWSRRYLCFVLRAGTDAGEMKFVVAWDHTAFDLVDLVQQMLHDVLMRCAIRDHEARGATTYTCTLLLHLTTLLLHLAAMAKD